MQRPQGRQRNQKGAASLRDSPFLHPTLAPLNLKRLEKLRNGVVQIHHILGNTARNTLV